MKTTTRRPFSPVRAYSWLIFLAVAGLAGCAAPTAPAPPNASGWTKDEVVDSYVFGYPLVLMTTARAAANDGHGAAVNTLHHAEAPPAAGASAQLTPNVDTLLSTAWIDLSAEPVVVGLPNTHGGYLGARVLDMWTNVVWSTGPLADARNGATKARAIALVPPGWEGTLPAGIERVDAPSTSLWLSVRVGPSGPRELRGARRLQSEIRVAPLSAFVADDPEPPEAHVQRAKRLVRAKLNAHAEHDARDDAPDFADTPAAQVAAVAALDAHAFFGRLADALRDNPPLPPDEHALTILADIGVKPGEPAHLPAGAADAIASGFAEARTSVATPPVNALSANGWFWLGDGLGHYDDDYALRAYAAATRAGVGTKDDEVFSTAKVDGDGQSLDGANGYVLHFAAKALPPARAFWTITAYTADGALADTRVPRHSIASSDALRRNRDGSLDIYVAAASPGRAHQANWLPAPSGPFELVMRLYAPQPQATDGSWQPPALVRQ